MTDTYSLLKNELKVYYPGVTDAELNEITNRLINFYTIGAKAVYENKKSVGIADETINTNEVKNGIFPSKIN